MPNATHLATAVVVVAGIAAAVWYFNRGPIAPTDATAIDPPTAPRAQPVRVVIASRQPIQAWVFAEGTARSVRREYLTFERAGRVAFVKRGQDGGDLRAGEAVRAGEVLARLDRRQYESEIDSAAASLAEAQTQTEVAQTDITQGETQYELAVAKFGRSKQLLDERATSQAEYEEAEANMKNAESAKNAAVVKKRALEAGVTAAAARLRQANLSLEETEITSPIDGIIAYLNIEEGYYFQQSNIRTTSESDALQTVPMVVIDPSAFEVTVDIPSYEAGRVQVGQEVMLIPGGTSATEAFRTGNGSASSTSIAGPQFQTTVSWQAKGTIFSINPAVNPGGRSVQLKIRSTTDAEYLRDGMFVACWIGVDAKQDAIVAPFDAFLFEESRPYVFVADVASESSDSGVARRVDVQVGIESLSSREILAGVQAGDRLVTDGRYRLVDGAPVKFVDN